MVIYSEFDIIISRGFAKRHLVLETTSSIVYHIFWKCYYFFKKNMILNRKEFKNDDKNCDGFDNYS
jgi:hypothetical protein